MNTVLAKVFIIETSKQLTNKKGENMGKIWDILQVIFGLLGIWLILDMSIDLLWVNGFFVGLGGWLGPFAILGYILAVIVILQLVKALLRED